MSVEFTNYTLSYDEGATGFPSFYSYNPDWMIGMNNYFYTFKGGNLYRHNVNSTRNNFYGQQYSTTIRSVFNDSVLQNKLFKTINIEGDSPWKVELSTDIQDSGLVESTWLEKKEQVYYAFVRNTGTVPAQTSEYALRSLNGIARSTAVNGGTQVVFDLDYKINNIISIGDMLYFALPPFVDLSGANIPVTPQLAGQITQVNYDPLNGINNLVIDNTIPGAIAIPIQDAYFLFIKNAVAESHGVLGHYCVFEMTNTDTQAINLFTLESEIMLSFP
jgi:hypothetical protein